MDSWAEVATGADVSVWVMDEVIRFPSSWGQVFFLSRFNGGLFDRLKGHGLDGCDGNDGNKGFDSVHIYFIIKINHFVLMGAVA